MYANDFNNAPQTVFINLQQISSLSGIKKFRLPLSGFFKGVYAVVSMQNGDRYYIDEQEYILLSETLHCG